MPKKAVGKAVPGSFPSAKEPIPGESKYVQLFGQIVMDCKWLEEELRRDKAQEEELVNNAIRAKIGYNFKTFASWARWDGITMALKRQRKFEEKLLIHREQLRELRRVRTELGLNTRDMLEKLKSHRHLEHLTERMAQLKIRPCPEVQAPHRRL